MEAFTNHSLFTDWRKCRVESAPYLFPGDEFLVEPDYKKIVSVYRSFEEFITSPKFGFISDKSLHLGLLPIPFVGNLQTASIFVLMANPGLSPCDYFAEQNMARYREALIKNLQQDNADNEYPFISLDPKFSWHSGYTYWHRKLQGIAKTVEKLKGISARNTFSCLARELAALELVPYHSKSFGVPGSVLKRLASSKAVLSYVHDILVPKARINEALIIAARSCGNWKLPDHENIIIYKGTEGRSAHLSLNSPGGIAIVNHLIFKILNRA